ncbi:mediator complex subunit [Podila clonocystis]|nr:mediator complex subunit [Podila clonocystis]
MDSWTTGNVVDNKVEALASADMMYLAYSMVRIRPVTPDLFVVQRLKDTQKFKGLDMDTVLLQFWLAALTGLAESNSANQRLLWKSLVFVKICRAVEMSLRHLSFYRGILNECDECIAEDGSTVPSDVLKAIATGCQAKGLIRSNELDIPSGVTTSQLILGDYDQPTIEAIEDLCGRALSDFEHQEKLVDKIIQVCEEASSRNDVSMLSKICQTLDDNPLVLDLINLLRSPSALLMPLENYVNNLQQNEEDDIDTCNSNLEGFGNVLILFMTTVRRYELAGCLDTVLKDRHGFCYLWLLRTSSTIPPMSLSSMSTEMHALMGRWISALFDSMGISDDLIQTSKPQMLLEIAPSVFEQSLAACHAGVIDSTTLNSGLDYFLQPCLLFVLIGVVQYLCEEIVYSTPGSQTVSSSATPLPGSSVGQSMLSPAGRVISPLATRGGKPGNGSQTSSGLAGAGQGKSAASVLMLQSSLKSLLAGESFPFRLMRLLRSEISAALESLATENDHQMGIIQDRLAEATVNYYPWSNVEPYEVNKLAQQSSLSFSSIVSGGRSSLVARQEKGLPVFGGSNYHIDVDLFRATLTYLGPAQFVANILEQLLAAAQTPKNGKRAAELGAAMLTTPLKDSSDQHLSPQSLLWTLMYQALWVLVPGKLETFHQGKVLALFVGMSLDLFQSRTYLQHSEKERKLEQEQQVVGSEAMDIDPVQSLPSSLSLSSRNTQGRGRDKTRSRKQIERDAAVEPFRLMLDQRLKLLSLIAQDRPGFEGFVQGIAHYQERQAPLPVINKSFF